MSRKQERCINCGMCCTDTLPLTETELQRIREHVRAHGIPDSMIDPTTCPFRDPRRKRCAIYEVRPLVCRVYRCTDAISEMEEMMRQFGERQPQSMRAAIFSKM